MIQADVRAAGITWRKTDWRFGCGIDTTVAIAKGKQKAEYTIGPAPKNMNPDNLTNLKKHFAAFEADVPVEGGDIEIIVGPNKGHVAIVGDRTALIRLATVILKHAIHGKDPSDRPNERALVLNNFFAAPSSDRDFMIQIEDETTKSRRPDTHSMLKIVIDVLFRKKLPSSSQK